MDYKLEIKPFVKKEGVKYKIIQITDIALHTAKRAPTTFVGKKIQKAFKTNTGDRIYSPIKDDIIDDGKGFVIELLKSNPDFLRMLQEEESKGYKVLISIPNEGIPIIPAEDTVQFMNSKNGKRVLRGLVNEEVKE